MPAHQQLCKENSLVRHTLLELLEPVPEQKASGKRMWAMAPLSQVPIAVLHTCWWMGCQKALRNKGHLKKDIFPKHMSPGQFWGKKAALEEGTLPILTCTMTVKNTTTMVVATK